jgi:flagellar protein FlaG
MKEMAANLDKLPSVAAPLNQSPAAQADVEPAPRAQPSSALDSQADYRLVIEEDPAMPGAFIYKTIDWATGTVVSQLPREQLVKLRDNPAYEAGSIFKTQA